MYFYGRSKIILLIIFFSFYINIHEQKPKISVFLPIYNKENYITKCIESIQKQTIKDIEIVAVNDYSTDRTLKILMNLSKNDNRIKIVNNNKNYGLLYSRAMGILNCSGKYLMNIDPDDELEGNDSLEYLYNQATIYNVDIISFDIYNKRANRIVKCKNRNTILKNQELINSIFNKNNLISDYLIWNKLIKREIFIEAYEYFKKEIFNWKWNYFEDDIWNILVHKYAKSKLCINKLTYIYNYNNDSLISNRFGAIEFKNVLYRHSMYKKLFEKKNEKYLIAEYFFLLNRLKWEKKYLLIINDYNINQNIINIFKYFLSNYKYTKKQHNEITNFLKSIIN